MSMEVKCSSDACPVSRQTMSIVPNCPTSESEWRKASQRKNCSAFASQCSYPDKLVYHCVINPFVNQTLEVCAYGKYIVLGYCTEYSLSGNIIQQNYDTDCSKFTQNPCPSGYHSTEAYKYPGCYELTKKSTVQNQTTMTTVPSIPTSDTYVPTQNMSMTEESNMEDDKDMTLGPIIGITIGVILVLLVGTTVVIFVLKRRKAKSKKQNLTVKETEENGKLMT
ncbi:uncharacterized protein LOC134228921 isoform X2 [Saccostrea cucullata]|uniref:uncharacterized protein LOC134228921 isoform X2 n=1 Tax=Saccostrea cuccullata TaxID=36930 RepID=UPI002ED1B432